MAVDEPSRAGGSPRDPSAAVSDPEEAAWVRQAQEGDLGAFERLYRRYTPRVFGLCLRMTGDASMAEELTQATFVRIWEKLHLFASDWKFSAWLYRVAVNVVLSERRSERRRTSRITNREELRPAQDPVAERRPDVTVDLQKAMTELPERARLVFVLHDIQGYRHREIARLTGVAEGTTKAQLHRARKLLRERLRHEL